MKKFEVLLRDFGYKLAGRTLIRRGIAGYSDTIVGTFRDAMDACEYLCPIVADEEFTRRLMKYQG